MFSTPTGQNAKRLPCDVGGGEVVEALIGERDKDGDAVVFFLIAQEGQCAVLVRDFSAEEVPVEVYHSSVVGCAEDDVSECFWTFDLGYRARAVDIDRRFEGCSSGVGRRRSHDYSCSPCLRAMIEGQGWTVVSLRVDA